ncbi:N-acetylgalactosamine-4-sulfatase [Haloarcula vallismortis ATCC 29715]|nr:N-acetylgalactosamine-4-sulfatase [Haloarcula vallismortis ATCC 29715]
MHSFFDEYTDTETLRELYHESVNESADRFIELIDTLEDASILENTLLVFISDHGEVLGEHGGLFTHAIPMVPELTEIPIVFVGAGLPKDQEMDALLSGTDIVPTVLNALGREPPKQVDGSDIWRQPPDSSQLLRSEVWKQTKYERLKSYVAGGVWDKNGGYVSHRGSWVDRFVYASGVHLIKGPHASVARTLSVSNYWEMFKAHLPSKIRYGDPDFEFSDAMEAIPEFEREESVTEPDVDRERLKQLGYLE